MLSEEEKQRVINHFSKITKIGNRDVLKLIPEDKRRYKCHTCHIIVDETPCPNCGEINLEMMCPLDHCHCTHDIVPSIAYCPLCGEGICPKCGTHNILQISRVTGYLSDVKGWNNSKKAELKDRHRYTLPEANS